MLAAALTIVAVAWLALIVTAPAALAHGRVPFLTFATYQLGARVCHQRPERSFHLSGHQMPVCARCFGLYVSGAAGLVLALGGLGRLRRAIDPRVALAVAAVPVTVTVALEWLSVISTSNVVRMSTGVPLGFAAGWILIDTLVKSGRDKML